jgi:hypothetical protein
MYVMERLVSARKVKNPIHEVCDVFFFFFLGT